MKVREYSFKSPFLTCRVTILNSDSDFLAHCNGFILLKARVIPLLEHHRSKYYSQLSVESLGDDFSLIDIVEETQRFCQTLKQMYEL